MTSLLFSPETIETDVLVVGGGLAGHQAAAAARRGGARTVLAYLARGASPYIIGANVPLGHADPDDRPAIFAADMIAGGYGLNDRGLVAALTENSTAVFEQLAALGVPFARDGSRYLQRHLSGNRYPRSVYVPDGAGRSILERLGPHCRSLGVEMLPGWQAVELLRDEDGVAGALLLRRSGGDLLSVRARAVVLATGGIGKLYDDSTYPSDVACGSYGLAFDAGATLIDMEFVQFEPTVTVHPQGCRGMEMPTAMLGDGATLVNAEGERFMFRYNSEYGEKRIEKARLALCIQREIDEGRGFPDHTVAMDTTRVPAEKLETYVSHCRRLRQNGLDPAKEAPRIRPAAHSAMGGIRIDSDGFTGIPGLFATGEAAGGVHGASRLAGNGGGETIVFGALIGGSAARHARRSVGAEWPAMERRALDELNRTGGRQGGTAPAEIKAALRTAMGNGAGLYRDASGLAGALAAIGQAEAEIGSGLTIAPAGGAAAAIEARHMALSARLIVSAALARTESRGAHQRRDFPAQDDDRWLTHIGFRRDAAGGPEMTMVAIG